MFGDKRHWPSQTSDTQLANKTKSQFSQSSYALTVLYFSSFAIHVIIASGHAKSYNWPGNLFSEHNSLWPAAKSTRRNSID